MRATFFPKASLSLAIPQRRDRQAWGFTLLEILVALAILSIAFVSLLGLHLRNLRLTLREQNLTRALLLAQEVMTRTLLEGLSAKEHLEGDFAEPSSLFRWEREILPTEVEGLWEVRVQIRQGEKTVCTLTYFTPLEP